MTPRSFSSPSAARPRPPRPSSPAARRLALLAALLIALMTVTPPVAIPANAAPTAPNHALVRAEAPGLDLAALAAAGYDVVGGKPGRSADIVATDQDVASLLARGLEVTVLQSDLEAFYAARLGKGTGFGDFHTYSEMMDKLDELHATYPTLTTAKWSLGSTFEGRAIWAIKVSDNPEVDEDEPEVLFDGAHHAREPMATEACLLLIEHLCANYATDPEARRLVDEREIFFVPIVNPDGYVYNELLYPDGGGMWRKNRFPNPDGSFGVDVNRNYPYEWEGDGSSPIPDDITYRGPYPASELEVQAMMAFAEAHALRTAQSFHTYSNLTLMPWGYTLTPCPDDAIFRDIAQVMCAENGYVYGPAPEILYPVNGGSVDWQYGEQTTKPKIFAFSNEIGSSSDGFWPLDSRIPALFADNLAPALYLIDIAGAALYVREIAITGGDGDGLLEPGESVGLALDVRNEAVQAAVDGVTVTLLSDDPYLQLGEAQRAIGALGPREIWSASAVPFPLTLDAGCPAAHVAELTVRLTWVGGAKDTPVELPVGAPSTLVSDAITRNDPDWTYQTPWGTTSSVYNSPDYSLTDSPHNDYSDGANTAVTLGAPLDFSHVAQPALRFWNLYELEANYDFGYVEASTDGANWRFLASATGSQPTWQEQSLSLASFAGQPQVWLRFRLQSDYSVTADGWYVDDVSVTGHVLSENAAPTAPLALAPTGGAAVHEPVVLTVANASDADGPSPLTYGFRVYADALFTEPLAFEDGVPETAGETSWTIPSDALDDPPLEGAPYYWRAWADDGASRGPLSAGAAFVLGPVTGVPGGEARAFLSAAPAASGTAFRFALGRPGRATLTLYSVRGERIATVFNGEASGETGAVWNQRNDAGAPVASGLYLARLSGPGAELSLKLLVVR